MSDPNDKANGKQEENLPSDSSENQQPSTEEILREVLKTATFFLFGVCLVAFIITVIKDASFFEFSNATLVSLGGAFNINIYDGEYWRIFTTTCLHGGFVHLLFNMFALLYFGLYTEAMYGRKLYIIIFLAAVFTDGSFSLYFNSNRYLVSVGISSAVIGFIVAFFSAIILFPNPSDEKSTLKEKLGLTALALFIVMVSILGRGENVDIAGHFGGAVCAMFLTVPYWYVKMHLKKEKLANGVFYFMAISIVFADILIISKAPKDIYEYHTSLYRIAKEHEEMMDSWNELNQIDNYQAKQAIAMEQVNKMKHLIERINTEVCCSKVEDPLKDRAQRYAEIIRLDIRQLEWVFGEPTPRTIPEDTLNQMLHVRDSLLKSLY